MIAIEGTIFAFGSSKKYDLSLLPTSGRVFDHCRVFDLFASVDAHLGSLPLPSAPTTGGPRTSERICAKVQTNLSQDKGWVLIGVAVQDPA